MIQILNGLLLILGFALLIKGADLFVDGSSEVARKLRVPGMVIGLTIVAIGTSLPELVTSIVAAAKKQTDMAVGNAIGSNIFNLLFILGISALIRPISVNVASVYDLVILILITVMAAIFGLTGRRIARPEGIFMILVYVADVVFAVLR